MNRITLLAALYGLLMAPIALAEDCRQALPGWLDQAHPGHTAGQPLQDERGSYRLDAGMSICKVWPARPHLILVAVPLIRDTQHHHGESDLEVLMVDRDRQAVVARLLQPHVLDWDAIFVDQLTFDTAPYRLRDDDLAFGVRISRRNGSGPNPFRETLLYLYELRDRQLRSLLGELPVSNFGAEWDTHCAGDFYQTDGVVIVTDQVGNQGYRDLLLKTKGTERRRAKVADECEVVEESIRRNQFRLKYDQERYLLPIELSPV